MGFGFFFKNAQYFADSYENIDLLSQFAEPPVFRTKWSISFLYQKKKIHKLKKGNNEGRAAVV